MTASLGDQKWNASALSRFLCAPASGSLSRRCNRTPHRSGLGVVGVAVPQQQLELMHIQTQGGLVTGTGPPAKPALRKPLLTEPVALTIIAQNLQGPAPSI